MGIFKRKVVAQRAEPVVDAVFTDPECERVTALWRLTALPRAEFDATYGIMLERCWRYVAAPGGEDWATLKDEALIYATAALRVRQARVLPRFGAAEEAARLHEVMSFALTAAVLAERLGQVAGRASAPNWCPLTEHLPETAVLEDIAVPRCYGALLLPRLVGDAGLAWLGQEPVAMRELATYFGEGPGELRAIAVEAAARVGLAFDVPAPETGPADGEPCKECEQPEEKSSDGEPADASEEPPADEDLSSPPATDPQTLSAAQPLEPIGGEGAGWRWFNWVRAGLRDSTIPANAEGSWLYNIAGEAYVVLPDGFEAFGALEGLDAKTVRNQVARLGRHRERKTPSGKANTFRAELPDGRRVDGMVFLGELIWDEDPPPLADGALGRRRR